LQLTATAREKPLYRIVRCSDRLVFDGCSCVGDSSNKAELRISISRRARADEVAPRRDRHETDSSGPPCTVHGGRRQTCPFIVCERYIAFNYSPLDTAGARSAVSPKAPNGRWQVNCDAKSGRETEVERYRIGRRGFRRMDTLVATRVELKSEISQSRVRHAKCHVR
jgi:hypothetical protein